MNIREKFELNEDAILIPEAQKSKDSKGRKAFEEKEDFRTCFMIDRDRIIHSKAFRRLKHKTQVFIRTSEDHLRTRLTHTLEVNQVGRSIAKAIGLNEDLVEAICLGHDLGHVPFAHNGEYILNKLLDEGFKHVEQSIRVVEKLEKDGKGLNLTFEVLDGIINHSGLTKDNNGKTLTLEAQVVKFADKIAYVNHDIDDAIRAGILKVEEIPKEYLEILGYTHSKRIDTLVRDCVINTLHNINNGENKVTLSDEVSKGLLGLRAFMFNNVYNSNSQLKEKQKAIFIVEHLFSYYLKNIDKLPDLYKKIILEEGEKRAVADYISGMTDEYAVKLFNSIFIP